MRTVAALFIAGASILAGQTRVRPEQIRNIEQVRIYFGDRTPDGTRVLVAQLSDGRHLISAEQWAISYHSYQGDPPADPGDLVVPVCIVDWYGIGMPPGVEDYVTRIIRADGCYTARSIPKLHNNPDWDAWLKERGW